MRFAASTITRIPEITTAFTQIVVIEAIVCLKQIVTDLLNGPLGIDVVGLDFLDDPIHKTPSSSTYNEEILSLGNPLVRLKQLK